MTEKYSISEIKARLKELNELDDPFILSLVKDERKGVQQALKQCAQRIKKEEALKAHYYQMQSFEREAIHQGYKLIAGIDEVGRGPLAGPVVAAAVILPRNFNLSEVNDSKKLSEKKREELFEKIMEQAVCVGIGIIDEQTIDQVNIYQATKLAMKQAIDKLSFTPDYLLLDAMKLEDVAIPQESIIKGDAKSVSIAAASIIAKVTRDRLMKLYDEKYPGYGFGHNAGYGTKEHLNALETQGICAIHRRTFAPIKEMI